MISQLSKYGRVCRRLLKLVGITSAAITLALALFVFSITCLGDPVSDRLRTVTERYLDAYAERLANRATAGALTPCDKIVLHTTALTGIVITKFIYPEASTLLYHYIYGDGSNLELPSDYFRESEYLGKKIRELGPGHHGPITLKQYEDWRLSLAFNPYYLSISERRIRIYHPKIEFAKLSHPRVKTVIPLGKLKLEICDNLISAMNPTPFFVYSEWEIE